jgi:mono/diheme cytochrome c family protein
MKTRTLFAFLLVVSFPAALMAEDAAAMFVSRCAPCHAKDGSGNTPMGKKIGAKALGSAEVQKLSDADLLKFITDGKGKMPSFGTKLSAEQIQELVKLVRSFATK